MSWTPLIEVDSGNLSDAEKQRLELETMMQVEIINLLSDISLSLKLLNARFEEAFETQIHKTDIEQ